MQAGPHASTPDATRCALAGTCAALTLLGVPILIYGLVPTRHLGPVGYVLAVVFCTMAAWVLLELCVAIWLAMPRRSVHKCAVDLDMPLTTRLLHRGCPDLLYAALRTQQPDVSGCAVCSSCKLQCSVLAACESGASVRRRAYAKQLSILLCVCRSADNVGQAAVQAGRLAYIIPVMTHTEVRRTPTRAH